MYPFIKFVYFRMFFISKYLLFSYDINAVVHVYVHFDRNINYPIASSDSV